MSSVIKVCRLYRYPWLQWQFKYRRRGECNQSRRRRDRRRLS